jgi:hypothetical protein
VVVVSRIGLSALWWMRGRELIVSVIRWFEESVCIDLTDGVVRGGLLGLRAGMFLNEELLCRAAAFAALVGVVLECFCERAVEAGGVLLAGADAFAEGA